VRMLGSGRPFVLEVINARSPWPSKSAPITMLTSTLFFDVIPRALLPFYNMSPTDVSTVSFCETSQCCLKPGMFSAQCLLPCVRCACLAARLTNPSSHPSCIVADRRWQLLRPLWPPVASGSRSGNFK
jgi:hypothetical protein